MEKQFDISSYKYTGPKSDNEFINSNISFSKIKDVFNSLDKAAKEIIIPILKIKKKIALKFDVFAKDYWEIKNKAEYANKEIISHPEESKSDSMNITDIQLNQKYAQSHENMIIFFENISNNIELFSNLFSSKEYDNLIKGLDELIPNNEIFSQEEKIKEKEEISKITKDHIKLKKPKRPHPPSNGANKKSLKSLGPSSIGNKKKIQRIRKHKMQDVDLLVLLQKKFPTNPYVRRISKTFISRRLFKKVIYRHIFDYKNDGKIEENKIRSSGESTVYKYGKFIFKFNNNEIKNTDKIDENLGKEMKQQFAKLDEGNKEYIIGGKIGCSHIELISRIFRRNLYNEFSVIQVVVEFYEFYEELVNEFNEKEEKVRIICCDEKILNNLREDWKNLEIVRNYIKQVKDSEK